MSFQNTAGTIILDAVLTDKGRRDLSQGKFKIEKFALGDDEVDYALGDLDGVTGDGYYYLYGDDGYYYITTVPVLEAHATPHSVINYGLIDLPRQDIILLPSYKLNTKISNSTSYYQNNIIMLSVNEETTKKLKLYVDINKEVIQNNEVYGNMIIIESGIPWQTGVFEVVGTKHNRDNFIYNMNLFDDCVFVHCNGNFVEKVLSNNINAQVTNDTAGNLYEDLAPLGERTKTNLSEYLEEYDTYYCRAVKNDLFSYDGFEYHDAPIALDAADNLSMFNGPRSSILSLNFKINQKMLSTSNAAPDTRYTLFGKTSQTLFAGTDTFDYVDTPVVVEGLATAKKFTFVLRIIRYAG